MHSHVPSAPPRPESLMHGVLKLRKMIQDDPDMGWRDRYDARGTEEIVASAPAGEEQAGGGQAPLTTTPPELTDPPEDPDA